MVYYDRPGGYISLRVQSLEADNDQRDGRFGQFEFISGGELHQEIAGHEGRDWLFD